MDFDRDVEIARVLDRFLEVDGVAVDLNALGGESFGEVHIGHRAKGFAAGAGGEFQGDTSSFDLGRDIRGVLKFPGFAFGALALECFEVPKMPFGGGISLTAGEKEIDRVAAFYFNDIGFDSEAVDFLFVAEVNSGHCWMRFYGSWPAPRNWLRRGAWRGREGIDRVPRCR
jgi:hypothetical protein